MTQMILKVSIPARSSIKSMPLGSHFIPQTKILLDTGSVHSLVDESLIQRYMVNYKSSPDSFPKIYALYSDKTPIGEVPLRFRISINSIPRTFVASVLILPKNSIPSNLIILGRCFMKRQNMLLEFGANYKDRIYLQKPDGILEEIPYWIHNQR